MTGFIPVDITFNRSPLVLSLSDVQFNDPSLIP